MLARSHTRTAAKALGRSGTRSITPRVAFSTSGLARQPESPNLAQPKSTHVKIVEVGPRDGLQNESGVLSANMKLDLIAKLVAAGLRDVESGSFVSPKWVPQMATTTEVMGSPVLAQLRKQYGDSLNLPVLVPNDKGMQSFLKLLASLSPASTASPPSTTHPVSNIAINDRVSNEIAIFISASESFSKANLNATIEQSLANLQPVVALAKSLDIRVRGYVSVVIGCPFEGAIAPEQVTKVVRELMKMGLYEISLGDTVGVGTPESWGRLIDELKKEKIEMGYLAAHCHDSFGTGIANILSLVKLGIRTVDSSIAGLGGCPYSPGATGNVATEDVIYALESSGYTTGVLPPPSSSPNGAATPSTRAVYDDLLVPRSERGIAFEKLAEVGQWVSKELSRPNGSRAGVAALARKERRRVLAENAALKAKL